MGNVNHQPNMGMVKENVGELERVSTGNWVTLGVKEFDQDFLGLTFLG